MNRIEKSIELYKNGYNCGQSVFCAFIDMMNIDENIALKLTQPLACGLGGLREICGAVNGMSLVIGMLEGSADSKDKITRNKVYDKVLELGNEFKKENGALSCKELLGLGEFKNPNVKKKPCQEYVQQCVELLENYLLKK